MDTKKLAKVYDVKRSILEHGCGHVIATQDNLDITVGANVGDIYFSRLTEKEIEVISKKENYIGCGSTGQSSRKFYYLRVSRKYKINSAIKKLKKIDLFLHQSGLCTKDITQKQINNIVNISYQLSDTASELNEIWVKQVNGENK